MLLLGPQWLSPDWLLNHFGDAMIWISLVIIFIECGLFFPFLPGDILLFFIGLFIKRAEAGQAGLNLNLWLACLIVSIAAFAGNVVGYEIGRGLGRRLYQRDGRIIKRRHLEQTRQFFDLYGNRSLVIGRFVPVVRTYVTVVAGVTRMGRHRFWTWSAVGAVAWATGVTLVGYLLGNITFLQQNIEIALLLVAVVPSIPMLVEWSRARKQLAATAAAEETAPSD
ncbi:MAG TPA: VTT domain-containing protein [Propionibacteriaceae bacterium]|nr:VTT domain-containing protein [Propionibacteriaceae bacterium]